MEEHQGHRQDGHDAEGGTAIVLIPTGGNYRDVFVTPSGGSEQGNWGRYLPLTLQQPVTVRALAMIPRRRPYRAAAMLVSQ